MIRLERTGVDKGICDRTERRRHSYIADGKSISVWSKTENFKEKEDDLRMNVQSSKGAL